MRHAPRIIGLLAGLLLLDLLVNAAGFDPRAAVVSLLRPSIDMLVAAAILLGSAQAGSRTGGEGRHRVARVFVCLFVAGITLYTLGRRFGLAGVVGVAGESGWALAAGWALVVVGAAALVVLTWIAAGLITRGFASGITRSVFLLAIALLAVGHVLAGNRIFSPSELPRIVRDVLGIQQGKGI